MMFIKGDVMKIKRQNDIWFVLPSILFLLILTMFPFIFTIFSSLWDWYLPEGLGSFLGIKNYFNVIVDNSFWKAISVSLKFVILTLLGEHVFGFLLALGISRSRYFKGFLTVGFMLPMMIPPIVTALIWRLMMHPATGVLNYFLELIGLQSSVWLHSPNTVIQSLVLVDIWQWTPFVMLVLLGGINSIPVEFREALTIDGGGLKEEIFSLTLPLIKPFFAVTLLLRFIFVFTTFDIIMALTKGGPGGSSTTLYLESYLTSFNYLELGRGSAMSIVIFIITFMVSTVLLRRVLKYERV